MSLIRKAHFMTSAWSSFPHHQHLFLPALVTAFNTYLWPQHWSNRGFLETKFSPRKGANSISAWHPAASWRRIHSKNSLGYFRTQFTLPKCRAPGASWTSSKFPWLVYLDNPWKAGLFPENSMFMSKRYNNSCSNKSLGYHKWEAGRLNE